MSTTTAIDIKTFMSALNPAPVHVGKYANTLTKVWANYYIYVVKKEGDQ